MFWLRSCPTNFDKINENSNCNFVSHKYKNGYLLEHASNGSLQRRDKYVSQHSYLLVTTFGFCNQLEKVFFDISARDQIFGAKNQLSQPRNVSHKRENIESNNKMSKFTCRTSNIDFRINKRIGFLESTIQTVLLARLQCRYLQLQQISSLKKAIHISKK